MAAIDRRVERRPGRRVRGAEATLALGGLDEVIAAAEALAVAGQQQDPHLWVEVGALDTRLELAGHRTRDPVAALRPVERQPRDAVGHLVDDRAHTGSARSMIAAASTPAGSVPYTRPP